MVGKRASKKYNNWLEDYREAERARLGKTVKSRRKPRKVEKQEEVQNQEAVWNQKEVWNQEEPRTQVQEKSYLQNIIEEVATNPRTKIKGLKEMTWIVNDDLDTTINLTNNGIELERGTNGKFELTYDELLQIKEIAESVLGYASAA